MRVLVMGASLNPNRYAYLAVNDLLDRNHEVLALGSRSGEYRGVKIETEPIEFKEIDTVTLYLGPKNQLPYYQYLVDLKPCRVIFNPGTENQELEELLIANSIEVISACTLVMLRTNQFE